MSVRAMSIVWQHFHRGGSEKLTLLAMADWCDDDGGSLYPSMRAIAVKIGASEAQTRRIIHGFIEEGLLSVVGNPSGGAPGQTRRYQLNLDRITATGSADARGTGNTGASPTPSADARGTGSTHARDALHPCTETAGADASQTTNRTTKNRQVTFATWLEDIKARGEHAIPEGSAVLAWASEVGLPEDFLALAWFEFKRQFMPGGTGEKQRYTDWRSKFRNHVEKGWLRLWYVKEGTFVLTTQGEISNSLRQNRVREAA